MSKADHVIEKIAKQSLTDDQHAKIMVGLGVGAGTFGAKVNTLLQNWTKPFGKMTPKSLSGSALKGFGTGALVGIGAGAALVAMDKHAEEKNTDDNKATIDDYYKSKGHIYPSDHPTALKIQDEFKDLGYNIKPNTQVYTDTLNVNSTLPDMHNLKVKKQDINHFLLNKDGTTPTIRKENLDMSHLGTSDKTIHGIANTEDANKQIEARKTNSGQVDHTPTTEDKIKDMTKDILKGGEYFSKANTLMIKEAKKKKKMTNSQKDFIAGTIAGAGATAAFYPLDTIITAKQAGSKGLSKDLKNAKSILAKAQRLYKGLPIKLLKNAPTTGVTLALYGALMRAMGGNKKKTK